MADDRELVTFDVAAQRLGVSVRRVGQLVSDGDLVAVHDANGATRIPADFLHQGVVLKGLPQVITLLRDCHYKDAEIIEWLYRPDDSLPGTPVQALLENRGREVKRRAQVAGF
jgi:hypothetical protein